MRGGRNLQGGSNVKKLASIAAAIGIALAAVASASANDCMRVSSSLQGLQQSTASGNWLAFDMTDNGGGVAAFVSFAELPQSTVPCFQAAYDASSAPRYFALGVGVAGMRGSQSGPGVLASGAPDKVLTNGTGIDHFDDSVLPVFLNALPTCLGI
jgi:hypothetical protein